MAMETIPAGLTSSALPNRSSEKRACSLRKLCDSGQVNGVYEIIVYPSSSKGFIQLNAEKRETIKGKKEAFLAYYRILNGYRKAGWEVEEIKG